MAIYLLTTHFMAIGPFKYRVTYFAISTDDSCNYMAGNDWLFGSKHNDQQYSTHKTVKSLYACKMFVLKRRIVYYNYLSNLFIIYFTTLS